MSRFHPLLVLALLPAGAFVVVTTFAFGGGTVDAIAFGVSIGTASLGAAAAATAPTRARAALHGGVVLVSLWTVLVALGIFSGTTQTWLIFAGGAAVTAAALGATAADELRRARREAASPAAVEAPAVRAA